MIPQKATDLAKEMIRAIVRSGDIVVDATLGNGYDALFLAQLVGPDGKVYGFDVQAAAILSSKARLQQAGLFERCELHLQSHEKIREVIREPLAAVMFNLGYLPGSDKSRITHPATTSAALHAAFTLLKPGGIITIVCYVGHEGGPAEAQAVVEWAKSLPEKHQGAMTTSIGHRPFLVSVRK